MYVVNFYCVFCLTTNLEERRLTYSCFEEDHIWWQSHAGNTQRKLHIQNAIDLHEGYFSAIRVYVVDESIKPHSIKKQIPMLDYWWKITDFNNFLNFINFITCK